MTSRIEEEGISGEDVDVRHCFLDGLELCFGERTRVDSPTCGIGGSCACKHAGGKKKQLFFHVVKFLVFS